MLFLYWLSTKTTQYSYLMNITRGAIKSKGTLPWPDDPEEVPKLSLFAELLSKLLAADLVK
jgi:hypothetical protein